MVYQIAIWDHLKRYPFFIQSYSWRTSCLMAGGDSSLRHNPFILRKQNVTIVEHANSNSVVDLPRFRRSFLSTAELNVNIYIIYMRISMMFLNTEG